MVDLERAATSFRMQSGVCRHFGSDLYAVSENGTAVIRLLHGGGSVFTPAPAIQTQSQLPIQDVAAVDWHGDGDVDFAVLAVDGLWVYASDGSYVDFEAHDSSLSPSAIASVERCSLFTSLPPPLCTRRRSAIGPCCGPGGRVRVLFARDGSAIPGPDR